jgi:hypothetical protein
MKAGEEGPARLLQMLVGLRNGLLGVHRDAAQAEGAARGGQGGIGGSGWGLLEEAVAGFVLGLEGLGRRVVVAAQQAGF